MYKPDKVPNICSLYLIEEDTINHFIGKYPKWSQQRGYTHYLSATEVVDSLDKLDESF